MPRRRHRFAPELVRLEDRTNPVRFSASGITLTVDVNNTGETVIFKTLTPGTVNISSSLGTSADYSGYAAINVIDSAGGAGVTFADSASGGTPVDYTAAFTVTLDGTAANRVPSVVTFNGNSSFGSNALNVTTYRNIAVNSGAVVSAGTGNITLAANQQGTPTAGRFFGIDVQGTISGGSGAVSLTGKGGNTNFSQYGVYVRNGGQVTSTGTGPVSVTGTGGASTSGASYGVTVENAGSVISSGGGNVTVTGQGGGSGISYFDYGLGVQGGGKITAGGSGTVTVQGVGGVGTNGYEYGVSVAGSSAGVNSTITSGSGGGSVNITGSGGGSGTSVFDYGVGVQTGGVISAGGSGSVTVRGHRRSWHERQRNRGVHPRLGHQLERRKRECDRARRRRRGAGIRLGGGGAGRWGDLRRRKWERDGKRHRREWHTPGIRRGPIRYKHGN